MNKLWFAGVIVLLFSIVSFADTLLKNDSDVQVTFRVGSADIVLGPRAKHSIKGDNMDKLISFSVDQKDAQFQKSTIVCPQKKLKSNEMLTIIARKSKIPTPMIKATQKGGSLAPGFIRKFKCDVQ
ncbi:MAG: hypothetical protein Q8S31_00300 [Alphaproteobacteria bacterium]|nr:hypothetical protein [Alphaproteobacteria bacterium]